MEIFKWNLMLFKKKYYLRSRQMSVEINKEHHSKMTLQLMIIVEEPKALFLLLTKRKSVSGTELSFSSIEFHKFLLEFLARFFEFSLLFRMILLQLFEFGMQLMKFN